jgi:transaldolase
MLNDHLPIKIFMDGASIEDIRKVLAANPMVKGFTTNPTLMYKAGVIDYTDFAKKALAVAEGLPISFEVLSDNFADMEREARVIAGWGKGANVKVPITNSKGESSCPLICKLNHDGIFVNITAVMTVQQVYDVASVLDVSVPAIISVFAGRIADTGQDPIPIMQECLSILKPLNKVELLWASPREVFNIFQASAIGCHITTATPEIIAKLSLQNKNLSEYSLETVKMFYKDAVAAGYTI